MAEPTNAPIVDADKIDQTKLTDELKKAANYEKLVENENNKELVTDDGKEIFFFCQIIQPVLVKAYQFGIDATLFCFGSQVGSQFF